MYSVLPSFVLGFHGCDASVAENVFSGKATLHASTNSYDWLGSGIYFWENSPERALAYAKLIKQEPGRCKEKIQKPAVVGAVIAMGHCLNLLDSKNLQHIQQAHRALLAALKSAGVAIPENKPIRGGQELLLRHLDCAVIEMTHSLQKQLVAEGKADYEFDTVRAVYVEGSELYRNSGFYDKNHIQICVRNPNCIKGYFRVQKPDKGYRIP